MATQANTGTTSGSTDRSRSGAASGLSSSQSVGSTDTSSSSTGSTVGGMISRAVDPKTMDQLNHFKDEALDRASIYYDQSTRFVRQNPFYFIGGAALLGFLVGSMVSKGRDRTV